MQCPHCHVFSSHVAPLKTSWQIALYANKSHNLGARTKNSRVFADVYKSPEMQRQQFVSKVFHFEDTFIKLRVAESFSIIVRVHFNNRKTRICPDICFFFLQQKNRATYRQVCKQNQRNRPPNLPKTPGQNEHHPVDASDARAPCTAKLTRRRGVVPRSGE